MCDIYSLCWLAKWFFLLLFVAISLSCAAAALAPLKRLPEGRALLIGLSAFMAALLVILPDFGRFMNDRLDAACSLEAKWAVSTRNRDGGDRHQGQGGRVATLDSRRVANSDWHGGAILASLSMSVIATVAFYLALSSSSCCRRGKSTRRTDTCLIAWFAAAIVSVFWFIIDLQLAENAALLARFHAY